MPTKNRTEQREKNDEYLAREPFSTRARARAYAVAAVPAYASALCLPYTCIHTIRHMTIHKNNKTIKHIDISNSNNSNNRYREISCIGLDVIDVIDVIRRVWLRAFEFFFIVSCSYYPRHMNQKQSCAPKEVE